jgi:hypothetical protein
MTTIDKRTSTMLALTVVVGQGALLASAWLLPAFSEFDLVGDTISELALGRFGAVQVAAFAFGGVGALAAAALVRRHTAGVRGSAAGSLLLAINGLALLVAAVFRTDRVDSPDDIASLSTTAWIHVGAALVGFLAAVAAMLLLTVTFAKAPRWRSIAVWSGLLASGSLALLFVQTEGPWVGLTQRSLASLIGGWMLLVAVRAYRVGAVPDAAPPVDQRYPAARRR